MTLDLPDPEPGDVERTAIEVTTLPTGAPETIPCVVANGAGEGPTVWVTGALHGNEVTATAVCQDVIHEGLPDRLMGRVVSLPILNPAGLRRNSRESYYDGDDPNRQFPDVEYVTADAEPEDTLEGTRPPSQQALICRRIFDRLADDADVLLDMHTASAGAWPFVIRDRVLYGRGLRDEDGARALAAGVDELAEAFGLPVVFEYPTEEYLERELQRSAAGAALNQSGIPALTVELGGYDVVDDGWHRQGVAGTFRVMEALGMVDDAASVFPDDLAPFPKPVETPMNRQVRRHVGPRLEEPGIVRHDVAPGDVLEEGDVVARVVSPTGEERATVRSDHDGWVIQRYPGIAGYEHAAVTSMAVADDSDVVGTPGGNGRTDPRKPDRAKETPQARAREEREAGETLR